MYLCVPKRTSADSRTLRILSFLKYNDFTKSPFSGLSEHLEINHLQ